MNSIRSSLSRVITLEGKPTGQHPYVCTFLKAVYQFCPNLPEYDVTWSISKVLDYLEDLGPNQICLLK